MKLTTITIAALLGGVVLPGAAFATMNTKEVQGCIIYERNGLWNKVDPDCEFDNAGSNRDNDAPVDLPPVVTPPDDDEEPEEDPVDEPPVDEPPVDEPPVDPAPVEEH